MQAKFFSHIMNSRTLTVRLDNLLQGRAPFQLVIAFINTDSFNGSYSKYLFNFKHYFLSCLDVNVNGKSIPRERPFKPDLIKKQLFIAEYALMFGSKWVKNYGNYISRENFSDGYTIYVNIVSAISRH